MFNRLPGYRDGSRPAYPGRRTAAGTAYGRRNGYRAASTLSRAVRALSMVPARWLAGAGLANR